MWLDHRPWGWLPLLVKGTGRDAIGAIGTALVIIGRYASFSISGRLSLLLLVSASGYASASTDAYGLLAGSNPKTDRFDRPGLGWWIEWTLNCVITGMSNLSISSFSIKAGMDSEKVLRSVPTVFSSLIHIWIPSFSKILRFSWMKSKNFLFITKALEKSQNCKYRYCT